MLLTLLSNQGAPVPPTPVDFSTIGGGGGFKLFRERQDDDRKELRRAIKMAMGLVDDPRPEVREEAKAIVAAVSPAKPITQINQVNISLILESRIRLEAILVHFERNWSLPQKKHRAGSLKTWISIFST